MTKGGIMYSKFKGYLAENNIQQKDIAALIRISPSALSKKINGRGGDFTVQEAKIICKKLNTGAEIFFG